MKNSIVTDAAAAGNTYITGYFYGTADYDPGVGSANLTAVGNTDIVFAKYNSSGIYQWAKNIGGTNNNYGNSIPACRSICIGRAVDASGNSYITGYFYDTNDW